MTYSEVAKHTPWTAREGKLLRRPIVKILTRQILMTVKVYCCFHI